MNEPQSNIINRSKILFVLMLLVFYAEITVSCYDKSSHVEKNRFKASIDLVSYQDNKIKIFYKINADDRYTNELSLIENVKGSPDLQKLVFVLPYGIRPKNFRINLGENENDSVRVENIRFQYKDCVINGDKGAYKTWFTFYQIVKEGKDSLTYRLRGTNSQFEPQLSGNQILNSKLVKLFPPDINESTMIIRNSGDFKKKIKI